MRLSYIRLFYLLLLCLLPAVSFAATAQPRLPPPGYAPDPELAQPDILPSGAIDLDAQWTNDGGARLYWDTVKVPQELKMNGRQWQDPALMPELKFNQGPAARKRAAPAVKKRVSKPKTVKKTAQKARKKLKPAQPIPLPVNEDQPLPPLTPKQQEERWVDARTESPYIEPPRLQ